MADNDDVSGSPDRDAEPTGGAAASTPEEPMPTVAQPVAAAEPAAPVLKTRWRDRAWSFRAMLAVALATFLIGGIAGGVVVAASGDDRGDHYGDHRFGPRGPGGPMMGGPGWRGRGPKQFDGGSPGWRWNDGPPAPDVTPYGGSTPSPGSTG